MSTNRELERLSLVGLVLTGLGLLTTIFNVVNSNSLVIVADLCSSLLEFASDLIAFGAFLLMRSRRVALLEYGLGKIESITSLLVSIMMIFGVLILLGMAVPRITHPVAITGFGIWLGLLCAAVFGVLNGIFWRKANKHLKQNNSPICDTTHHLFLTKTLMDSIVFITLFVALTVHQHWVHYLDLVGSLIICGFMIAGAWRMIRHSLRDLADHSIAEPLQIVILKHLAKHFDAYAMLDKVRSRCSGPDTFIDIFLAFDSHRSMADVQIVISDLQAGLEQDIPKSHVTVVSRAYSAVLAAEPTGGLATSPLPAPT